jgi:hypothetical protein
MFYRVHLAGAGFEITMLVVIGADCICSCKSNYHTTTTTNVPSNNVLSQLLFEIDKIMGLRNTGITNIFEKHVVFLGKLGPVHELYGQPSYIQNSRG